MRLLAGASLSVVNSGTCPAMRLKASIDVFGSTEEIMMALVPAATRSSISAFCSAAVPCAGYLNWSSYFGSSRCAFLTPASASFQKSGGRVDDERQLLLFLRQGLCRGERQRRSDCQSRCQAQSGTTSLKHVCLQVAGFWSSRFVLQRTCVGENLSAGDAMPHMSKAARLALLVLSFMTAGSR